MLLLERASGGENGRGAWINTDFYRGAALPILAYLIQSAYGWILEQRDEAKQPV